MMMANNSCIPNPQVTNCQEIALRLLDIARAMLNNTRMPAIPIKRSIDYYGASKQCLHLAS